MVVEAERTVIRYSQVTYGEAGFLDRVAQERHWTGEGIKTAAVHFPKWGMRRVAWVSLAEAFPETASIVVPLGGKIRSLATDAFVWAVNVGRDADPRTGIILPKSALLFFLDDIKVPKVT